MALSAPRSTITRKADDRLTGVKANTRIWQGSIAVNDAGIAAPGRTAVGLVVLGMALETADNIGGAAGDIKVPTRRAGAYLFKNSTTDPVTAASIGKTVFIVDDETVSATNAGGNTQSPAGTCFDVEAAGVWLTFA